MPKFPADLAVTVADRWTTLVRGEYVVPDCPSREVLTSILELSYLASSAAEEGRYPHFNVLVTRKGVEMKDIKATFLFDEARLLTLSELRRLAPASDFRKSAIWVGYEGEAAAVILGLADLGTSWHRARLGFAYKYHVPRSLIVQVDRPGRLKVYQGEFHVATLADGELIDSKVDLNLFLHSIVDRGLKNLAEDFSIPTYEHPSDFENFWFIAHANVFAAIVNSISFSGHGGVLIVADQISDSLRSRLRVKYSGSSDMLRSAFVSFINARNKTADFYESAEQNKGDVAKDVFEAELSLTDATDQLIEAIRFVAQLAGCDGAIVLSPDLTLLGFGAEIRGEIESGLPVLEVIDGMQENYQVLDVEQFGMRHRSCVKLASQAEGSLILAVSQDGPITAVWRKHRKVLVRRGVTLVNMNLPWG